MYLPATETPGKGKKPLSSPFTLTTILSPWRVCRTYGSVRKESSEKKIFSLVVAVRAAQNREKHGIEYVCKNLRIHSARGPVSAGNRRSPLDLSDSHWVLIDVAVTIIVKWDIALSFFVVDSAPTSSLTYATYQKFTHTVLHGTSLAWSRSLSVHYSAPLPRGSTLHFTHQKFPCIG